MKTKAGRVASQSLSSTHERVGTEMHLVVREASFVKLIFEGRRSSPLGRISMPARHWKTATLPHSRSIPQRLSKERNPPLLSPHYRTPSPTTPSKCQSRSLPTNPSLQTPLLAAPFVASKTKSPIVIPSSRSIAGSRLRRHLRTRCRAVHGGWLRYMRRQEAVGCDVAGEAVGGRRGLMASSSWEAGEVWDWFVLWVSLFASPTVEDRVRHAAAAGKEMHTSQLHTSAPGLPITRSSREGGRLTSTGETVG